MGVLVRELARALRGASAPAGPRRRGRAAERPVRRLRRLAAGVARPARPLEAQTGPLAAARSPERPTLELPTDRPRPAVRTHAAAIGAQVALPPAWRRTLHAAGPRPGGDPLHGPARGLRGAASAASAARRTWLVGTPIANRTPHEIEGLIGFFVNTLVLRVDLAGDPDLRRALVRRAREVALGGLRPPGPALREAGRGAGAGPGRQPHAALPGDVHPAGLCAGSGGWPAWGTSRPRLWKSRRRRPSSISAWPSPGRRTAASAARSSTASISSTR